MGGADLLRIEYIDILPELLALDFSTGRDAVTQLCDLAGVTEIDLLTLGQQALNLGVCAHTTEKEWEFVDGMRVSGLRNLQPTWREIDGTIPHRNDRERYFYGPNWKQNSCAIDCTLFCALQLDAGRIQIDQITAAKQRTLSEAARILRQVVTRPWGTLTPTQRNQLRDILADTLSDDGSGKFVRGNYLDIHDVLLQCLGGLPQISYTTAVVKRCCDGLLCLPNSVEVRRSVGFWLTRKENHLSVQQAVQDLFAKTPCKSEYQCNRNEACIRSLTRFNLILDRLPPILLLHLPSPVSHQDDKIWKLFEDLTFTYTDTTGDKKPTYTPLGCIIVQNRNHFMVRWQERYGYESIIHYDGLVSDRAHKVDGWWAGLTDEKSGGIRMEISVMFYIQV